VERIEESATIGVKRKDWSVIDVMARSTLLKERSTTTTTFCSSSSKIVRFLLFVFVFSVVLSVVVVVVVDGSLTTNTRMVYLNGVGYQVTTRYIPVHTDTTCECLELLDPDSGVVLFHLNNFTTPGNELSLFSYLFVFSKKIFNLTTCFDTRFFNFIFYLLSKQTSLTILSTGGS